MHREKEQETAMQKEEDTNSSRTHAMSHYEHNVVYTSSPISSRRKVTDSYSVLNRPVRPTSTVPGRHRVVAVYSYM
jgi:hypothetical protein